MPTYLNSGTRANSSGATSRTPALPGSRVNGNALIAVVGSKNNFTHTSSSSGWTKLTQRNSGTGWTVSFWLYNRTSGGVDGSEAAPAVTVASSNVACFGQVHQFTGPVHPTQMIGATNENDGTSSTHSCTGVNTTAANSLMLYLDAAAANKALATPSGWAENVDNGSSTGATRNTAGSKAMGGSGSASGDISVTGANAAWVMVQVELLAAPPHEYEKGRYETDASQDDYTFPTYSPHATNEKCVGVFWYGTVTTMPTLSGCGLTWTRVEALEASDYGAAFFRATAGTPSEGTLTVNFGGTNPSRSCGVIIEIPANVTGVAQSKTNSTGGAGSLTVTFDSAPDAGNYTLGIFNGKWPHTEGSGFTALAKPGTGTNFDQIRALFEYKTSGDQTVDTSFDFSAAVGIAIALTISTGYTLAIDAASVNMTANAVGLLAGHKLTVDAAALTITANDAGLVRGYPIAVEPAAVAITGNDVGLMATRLLAVDAASVSLTGNAVGLLAGRKLTVDAAALTITANDAGLVRGYPMAVEPAAVAITGNDVGLMATRLLAVDAASVSLTGNAVGLLAGRKLTVDAASLTITANDVTLKADRRLAVDAAAVTITGNDTGLLAGRLLSVEAASVALTAHDVTLTYGQLGSYTLTVDVAALAITANDVTLEADRRLAVDAAAVTITGNDTGLLAGRLLSVEAGSVTVTAHDVALTYEAISNHVLTVEAAAFALLFHDVGLMPDYLPNARLLQVGYLTEIFAHVQLDADALAAQKYRMPEFVRTGFQTPTLRDVEYEDSHQS